MLPPEVVRWVSGAFFLLGVGSLLLFFPREARRGSRTVRTSRPLSLLTGPVWEGLQVVFIFSPLVGAALPDWLLGGPFTFRFPFDSIVQGIGIVLWPAGGILAIWAMRTLGRFTRAEIEVRSDHRLVAEGPYRGIRHPIYTALLAMAAGVSLLLLNALLLILFVLAYAIARRRAFLEEDLLASDAGLGIEYRRYMGRTGRFLPRFRATEREGTGVESRR